ncbi:MAG: PAS domain S-box protein [Anaerolineaceae bacterium]|nr:PAS domain S-box protein [Anaerolineaceae bacterium]
MVAAFMDVTVRKQMEQQLRTSEARLQAILDHSPALISIKDLQGQITLVNRNFDILDGPPHHEYIGKNVYDMYPRDIADTIRSNDLAVLETDGSIEVEEIVAHKDGSQHTYLTIKFPLYGKDDKPFGVCAISTDITERKLAEAALRESEARYVDLYENAPDMYVSVDAKTALVRQCNQTLAGKSGYSKEEIIDRPIFELYHPDCMQEVKKTFKRFVETGEIHDRELQLRRKDGSKLEVSLNVSAVRDENGNILYSRSTWHDITERKRAEKALKSSDLRFQAFMDNMPAIAFYKDEDGRYQYANTPYEKYYGFTEADWKNKKDQEIWPERVQRIRTDDVRVMETEETHVFETDSKYLGDAQVWLVHKFVFRDAEGKKYLGNMGLDITDRKRAELELERSNAELENFAYIASHDLKEPLRAISGYLQLLKQDIDDKLSKDANLYIDRCVSAAKRQGDQIDALLAYSRVGRYVQNFQPTDCDEILANVRANLRVQIHESDAHLTADPLPTLMCDSMQIEQLFQNLISNAIKFRGNKKPQIHIGVARERERMCYKFSVCDNGIGIDPRHAERIFLIFQRLHTRAAYPGAGIGLAICKKIVERHGGEIWVEPNPDGGSIFYFTLPDRGSGL